MTETITVDQDNREVTRGLGYDSIITCTQTSAPDVYVAAITPKDTTNLSKGDSTAEPRLTRVKFYLFRKQETPGPYSATVVIADAPPAPKVPDHSLAVQFHLPQQGVSMTKKAPREIGRAHV